MMTLKVGLTGGIGSGKTRIARIFESLGIPVLESDSLAKQLMQEDKNLQLQLIAVFGNEIYKEGVLQRKILAEKVFNHKTALNKLNSIVHPAVKRYSDEWFAAQTAVYAIKEAAILIEADAHIGLDVLIGVSAPEAIRIERTMERDGVSREEVLKRMSKQMDNDEKMKLCDFVILNDGHQNLEEQVRKIHQELIERATQTNKTI